MRQLAQHKTKLNFLLGAILFLSVNSVFANALFEQANACYKNKQYTQAVAAYLQVIKGGDKNAAVYFNLANAYYRLNEFPRSVLYYEKALKLDPGNDKIEHNLKLAYDRSLTKIEESQEFFVFKYLHHLFREYSARSWSVLFLIFLWISILFFLVYFNKTPGTGSSYLKYGLYSLLFSVVLFFVAKNRYYEQIAYRQAIVLQPNTELKAEPVEASKTKVMIEAGNKVDLLDKDAGWYKVALQNGKEGWISEKTLVKI